MKPNDFVAIFTAGRVRLRFVCKLFQKLRLVCRMKRVSYKIEVCFWHLSFCIMECRLGISREPVVKK
jgi:hypothetical protein